MPAGQPRRRADSTPIRAARDASPSSEPDAMKEASSGPNRVANLGSQPWSQSEEHALRAAFEQRYRGDGLKRFCEGLVKEGQFGTRSWHALCGKAWKLDLVGTKNTDGRKAPPRRASRRFSKPSSPAPEALPTEYTPLGSKRPAAEETSRSSEASESTKRRRLDRRPSNDGALLPTSTQVSFPAISNTPRAPEAPSPPLTPISGKAAVKLPSLPDAEPPSLKQDRPSQREAVERFDALLHSILQNEPDLHKNIAVTELIGQLDNDEDAFWAYIQVYMDNRDIFADVLCACQNLASRLPFDCTVADISTMLTRAIVYDILPKLTSVSTLERDVERNLTFMMKERYPVLYWAMIHVGIAKCIDQVWERRLAICPALNSKEDTS
ncbi:hypothetical protein DL93DRAFT_2164435 [Clavulina sp. PMI_390]|nr:hypothetical protein DL93DRAFT_2164435 [Clavulina sp. PMI_390]